MKEVKTVIKLHPKQYDAFHFQKQFGAVICGVQSGKTFLGTIWTQKKVDEFPTKNGLIAAPTVKILNQSTLEKFFQNFPEYRQYYKKQEAVIELPSGGKIFLRSTDEPLGLEGMTLHWAWLDEAGMMSRMIWLVIKARVSTTGGQVLFTSTPYNLGWFYQEIYKAYKDKTDDRIECFTWKSVENPYFPKEFYDKEKSLMRPEEFARRYEGEFTKLEGLVWEIPDDQIIDTNTVAMQKVLSFPDRVIAGVDWGFHNPSGIVVIKVKDAVYYVVEEWKEPGKTTAEIVAKAQELKEKHGIFMWYPDPAEPDRIEEFKRAGLMVGAVDKTLNRRMPTDPPIGLSLVTQLIREKRLFISKDCTELLDEIGQYHYEEGVDGKPLKEQPVKVNDHLCDALRYACMGFRAKEKTVEPVNVPNKINTLLKANAGRLQVQKMTTYD